MKDIWRILRFSKPLWPYYGAISAFTILLSAMSQLQPLFTKGAIDEITKMLQGGQADVARVAWFAVFIFLTDLGQTILSNWGGYVGDLMSVKLQQFLSQKYFAHILKLPQKYFDTELSGKIINRMTRGISQIGSFMQTLSNNFLQFLFSTIFSLIIVFYYAWPVGLMLLTIYPIFIWLTTRTSTKWQTYQKEINEQQDIASGRFAETVGQVRVVKSFLQEARELNFFSKRYDHVLKTTRPQSRLWHKQDIVRRTILNIIFLGVYAYIFVETARGTYTLGTMVMLIQYAMLIRIPIFTISFLVDQTQRAVSNTKDYFEVMDQRSETTDMPDAKELIVGNGQIEFKNVHFGYDKNPVLKGINLTISADSKAALVGESGEGKSTLTNLLLRLYDIQKGEIVIDSQNINDVTQASLRANIGIVFQEPALFSGTIRENIAYANPGASEQDIVAAAKAANAHDFIEKFEKGYETEIGERGLKLSGGQKQRIAIARALLKDAPILILDEATSSLDSKSEHMVQEALERLMKGRTTLIIAHRLSTIQNVDQIITLQNGKVSETGTPEQLAKTSGIYAQLLRLQQHGISTEQEKKKLKQFDISA
jgi:ATP-binding cassette subfamily B protein